MFQGIFISNLTTCEHAIRNRYRIPDYTITVLMSLECLPARSSSQSEFDPSRSLDTCSVIADLVWPS